MGDYEYHEPLDKLTEMDRNFHRALKSLQEELEAVDWYHQRAAACQDPALREIILHNRNEEMEHAAMLLEWLRRNMPPWNDHLRTYLFTEQPITQIEEKLDSPPGEKKEPVRGLIDLKIGNLKEERSQP